MYHPSMPPAPPPKAASGEEGRTGMPGAMGTSMSMGKMNMASRSQPPAPYIGSPPPMRGGPIVPAHSQQQQYQQQLDERSDQQGETEIPDPGDSWLPLLLKDKSKRDLEVLLGTSSLLNALTNSPTTIHPSLSQSYRAATAALNENIRMASQLLDLETQLSHQRASTQAQLLSAHALERQWQQKQRDMDNALNPFSPSSLYQKLGQGLQDQDGICRSLEDSFLEGGFAGGGQDGIATEREVLDWTRRYRDQKRLYYLRRERKARWDEGRVGGWR